MNPAMKRFLLYVFVIGALMPTPSLAQWSTTHEQFYLPGSFNWEFRRNYPGADRLFNAFDYGHAILYERLWNRPKAPVSDLETREFDFITRRLLVNPPDLPLEEAAIEIGYVKIAPEAKMMFEWAHLLHRQIYDVLADEGMNRADKDAKVQELLRYYKSRRDLAFSSTPKSMELMEGQSYSLAFRKRYPKFNGLIWAYHWLQIGLYEPLLAGKSREERQTGVAATVTRFRQLIEQPPTRMPAVMPMTPAVAPLFTARYPEAAIIFDNLHSMHDVISDILANPSVPRDRKREEILRAGRRYRDNSSFVTTVDEWREMAAMMGVEKMGGVAGASPLAAAAAAASAAADHSAHAPGVAVKKPETSSGEHAGHAPSQSARAPAMDHSSMRASPEMKALHERLMADSVIRTRVHADTVLRDLLHKALAASAPKKPVPAAKRSTARAKKEVAPPAKPSPKARAKPKPKPKADPMEGMDHSKHKK